jgi:hypothetical protein
MTEPVRRSRQVAGVVTVECIASHPSFIRSPCAWAVVVAFSIVSTSCWPESGVLEVIPRQVILATGFAAHSYSVRNEPGSDGFSV